MKPTTYPSIKNKTKVLLLSLLLLGLIACQQEEEFLPKTPPSESTVLLNEVKSWYEGADKITLVAAPQWNNSWVKIAGEDAAIVKVPLNNAQFADSIYWDVLFQKRNGTIHALLIQVKAAPEYLAEKRKELGKASLPIRDYVENKDFTGDVYLYSLGGDFQMGRRFQEGTIIHQLHPLSSFKNLQAKGRDIFSKEAPVWDGDDDDGTGDGGSGTIDGGTLPGVVVTAPAYEGGSDQGGTTWFIPSDRGSDFDYPSGEVPIGGGGGVGSDNGNSSSSKTFSESDLSDFEFLIDPGEPIKNIEDYIKCFNDGKPGVYKLALYVDQPVAGKNDQYKIHTTTTTGIGIKTITGSYDVGHAFVTFKKVNTDGTYVRQTFGFYPGQKVGSGDVQGIVKDDNEQPYDVGYVIAVSKEQFFNALNQVQQDIESEKNYVLSNVVSNEYNCSDAALSWLKAGGVEIPNASRGLFKTTPGDLGEELRKLPDAKTQSGKAGKGNGPCG